MKKCFILIQLLIFSIHFETNLAFADGSPVPENDSSVQNSASYQKDLAKIGEEFTKHQHKQMHMIIGKINTKKESLGYTDEQRLNSQTQAYINTEKKAPIAIVTIHGLWGTGQQFENLSTVLKETRDINYISVVLPGHGFDVDNKNVNLHDWIEETDHAIKIARQTSDKVIVMGQSTGGLLAFEQALKGKVDGLILVEPALKVRNLKTLASCVADTFKLHYENSLIQFIANTMDIYSSSNANLGLGCEVDRLRKYIEAKYLTESDICKNCALDENGNIDNEHSVRIQELFGRVKIPMQIWNRPGDKIVDSDVVDELYNLASGKKEKLTLDKNQKHGSEEFNLNDLTTKFLIEFIRENFYPQINKEILDAHQIYLPKSTIKKVQREIYRVTNEFTKPFNEINVIAFLDPLFKIKSSLEDSLDAQNEATQKLIANLQVLIKSINVKIITAREPLISEVAQVNSKIQNYIFELERKENQISVKEKQNIVDWTSSYMDRIPIYNPDTDQLIWITKEEKEKLVSEWLNKNTLDKRDQ